MREESKSIDTLTRYLGVGRKTATGADLATLWSMSPEPALQYLANDLHLTRRCADALCLITHCTPSLSL